MVTGESPVSVFWHYHSRSGEGTLLLPIGREVQTSHMVFIDTAGVGLGSPYLFFSETSLVESWSSLGEGELPTWHLPCAWGRTKCFLLCLTRPEQSLFKAFYTSVLPFVFFFGKESRLFMGLFWIYVCWHFLVASSFAASLGNLRSKGNPVN